MASNPLRICIGFTRQLTAHGSGLTVNSKNKQETFMKMLSAGVGVGAGVKDFRAIFVFETEIALTSFINSGWEAGGQADAAAKAGKEGGAYSGRPQQAIAFASAVRFQSGATCDPAWPEIGTSFMWRGAAIAPSRN
jgi:lipid-binding SYLF domain-containing protein